MKYIKKLIKTILYYKNHNLEILEKMNVRILEML